ncbi:MAG TPA: MFS transporter, partial [Anaerolineaceae bacterium]|nr:MFS transporter [Anaerolineaceae bacterium]
MQLTFLQSLTHRPFALIWSGQTISRLGDSLYRIALAWWVLEKTGSAAIMGAVLIFSFTPMLIFSLVGGVLVDRFPRVRIMIASDLLRGLAVGLVAALTFTQRLEIVHIYAVSVLFGLVDAFFQPAYTAVLPEIAPREILPSANSLTSLSGQFASIVGPALGGALVGAGGTPIAFAVNAVSFLVSAACLAPLLRIPQPSHAGNERLNVAKEAMVGIKVVLGAPWLWVTILIAALLNVTLSGPWSVALPFLIKDTLQKDAGTLGLVSSALSVGAVLAAVWLGRYSRLRRRGLIAY